MAEQKTLFHIPSTPQAKVQLGKLIIDWLKNQDVVLISEGEGEPTVRLGNVVFQEIHNHGYAGFDVRVFQHVDNPRSPVADEHPYFNEDNS